MRPSPTTEVVAPELVVARANGDFWVHLAENRRSRSLCGKVLRTAPPHKSLREAACSDCVATARDAGHLAAREGHRTWINLSRI